MSNQSRLTFVVCLYTEPVNDEVGSRSPLCRQAKCGPYKSDRAIATQVPRLVPSLPFSDQSIASIAVTTRSLTSWSDGLSPYHLRAPEVSYLSGLSSECPGSAMPRLLRATRVYAKECAASGRSPAPPSQALHLVHSNPPDPKQQVNDPIGARSDPIATQLDATVIVRNRWLGLCLQTRMPAFPCTCTVHELQIGSAPPSFTLPSTIAPTRVAESSATRCSDTTRAVDGGISFPSGLIVLLSRCYPETHDATF
jgi:hypothetical protein